MKKQRHHCVQCGQRIVAMRWDGRVAAPPKDHDLCQRCYRSERDRHRMRRELGVRDLSVAGAMAAREG
jgi:hypothetical protein